MAALSVDGFILVDTNILIYHLKGLLETPLKAQLAQALAVGRVHISVITRMEMLAWRGHTEASMAQTQALLALMPEFGLTEDVVQEAIRIRREFGLKLPDAVIAATAMTGNHTLLTGNGADFGRVHGLQHYLI